MTTPEQTFASQLMADAASPDAHDFSKLHPELKPYVVEGALGTMIRAPLLVDIAPIIPTVNRRYVEKKARFEQAVAEKNWGSALVWVERPYRLMFLSEWRSSKAMTLAEFRKHLPWVWSDAEPDDTDPSWLAMWQYAALDGPLGDPLPGKSVALTVYRGQHSADDPRGIAWSLDPNVAKMFAHRFNPNEFGVILRGRVERSKVLAYINAAGRGEQEVVCNPADVRITGSTPVPTLGDIDARKVRWAVWDDFQSTNGLRRGDALRR